MRKFRNYLQNWKQMAIVKGERILFFLLIILGSLLHCNINRTLTSKDLLFSLLQF